MTTKYSGCLSPKPIVVGVSVTPDVLTFNSETGKFEKANKAKQTILADCGKCINCLMKMARQKAARFNAEYESFPDAYILHCTLTFAGKPPPSRVRIPESGELRKRKGAESVYSYPAYEIIQLMHKRMRKAGMDFSFLSCEEVGDKGRLHFHNIYIFKNPDIIPDWDMATWNRMRKKYLRTRQDWLDYQHDVLAPCVSYEKVGNNNKTYPPSNWLKVFRFLMRFVYWQKGIVTVTQSQHIGGVVHYLTSYALEYASTYAKEKNLPPPVWRCSRLGQNWYKDKESAIKNGSLRTLPLGNGYSISMPKYRLKKYRDPYDRLQDYFRSIPSVYRDKSVYCKAGLPVDFVEQNRKALSFLAESVYTLMDMPDFDDIPVDIFYNNYYQSLNTILNSKHYD